MKQTNQFLSIAALAAGLLAGAGSAAGAVIAVGPLANLGSTFFPVVPGPASTGGGDANSTSALFARSFGALNVGTVGSEVTLTGMAWALSGAGTTATTANLTVTYLGLDGVGGGGDDQLIGTSTATLTFTAAGVYIWDFDADLVATIPAANISGSDQVFRLQVDGFSGAAPANLRYKTSTGTILANVKLSVAGSSVAVIPEPSAALLGGFGLLALMRRRR